MTAGDLLRALLLLDVVGMLILAIFYLRQRPLSWFAFLAWGLLAVLVPVLGPFIAIAAQPGRARRRSRVSHVRLVKFR
jgi:hypothetical protein